MGNVSKAIAAGLGGAVGGGATSALVLPEGAPWWAYLVLMVLPTLTSAFATYAAPKNTN